MIGRRHRGETSLVPERSRDATPAREKGGKHHEAEVETIERRFRRSCRALCGARSSLRPPSNSQRSQLPPRSLPVPSQSLSVAAGPAPSSPASPSGWPSSAPTTCAPCRPSRSPAGTRWCQGAANTLGRLWGGLGGSHLLLYSVLGLHIEQGTQVGQMEQGQGAQGRVQHPHPQRLRGPRNPFRDPLKPCRDPPDPPPPRVLRPHPQRLQGPPNPPLSAGSPSASGTPRTPESPCPAPGTTSPPPDPLRAPPDSPPSS